MKKFLIIAGGTAAGILLAIFAIITFIGGAAVHGMHEIESHSKTVTPTVSLRDNNRFEIGGLTVTDMGALRA